MIQGELKQQYWKELCNLQFVFPFQGSGLSHSCNHNLENHYQCLFCILTSDQLDGNRNQQEKKKKQHNPVN